MFDSELESSDSCHEYLDVREEPLDSENEISSGGVGAVERSEKIEAKNAGPARDHKRRNDFKIGDGERRIGNVGACESVTCSEEKNKLKVLADKRKLKCAQQKKVNFDLVLDKSDLRKKRNELEEDVKSLEMKLEMAQNRAATAEKKLREQKINRVPKSLRDEGTKSRAPALTDGELGEQAQEKAKAHERSLKGNKVCGGLLVSVRVILSFLVYCVQFVATLERHSSNRHPL